MPTTATTSVATQPASGTVTVNTDGSLTYAPTGGFTGTTNFTYRLTDARGRSSTATVTLTVGVVVDAGTDAGLDAGTTVDAGFDAGTTIDAGFDAGTTVDAGFDAGSTVDAGFDAGTTVDAGFDAGSTVDAGFDAGTVDAGFDAGTVDAGFDAGTTDAGADAGVDVDMDGLPDDEERRVGSDPNDADSDDDGVKDGDELTTDGDGDGLIGVLDPDSDDDGLFDGTERGVTTAGNGTDVTKGRFVADADPSTTTDPNRKDTDRGGVPDGAEDTNLNGRVDSGERNPNDAADDTTPPTDTDGDGLPDALERFLGSDPTDADTDDDGLRDGEENNPSDDTDRDGLKNVVDPDSDGDGLFDGTERGVTSPPPGTDVSKGNFVPDADPATRTSPLLADTDRGGVRDGVEDLNRDGKVDSGELDPNLRADDATPGPDMDGDGLPDAKERQLGTDPADADSDDDGVKDGDEPDFAVDSDKDGRINALDPDSDGDGLFDGTELGVTQPPTGTDTTKGFFRPDADPSTKTSAVNPDTDRGGVSDGIEDANRDGKFDGNERDPNLTQDDDPTRDSDGDTIPDVVERAIDTDGDGTPDFLDTDSDADGKADKDEAGDANLQTPPVDTDGDGLPDYRDVDSDGDEVPDAQDTCRTVKNADQRDTDKDGQGDACDTAPFDGLRLEGGGCASTGSFGFPLAALLLGAALRRRRLRGAGFALALSLCAFPAAAQTTATGGFSLGRYAPTTPGESTFWAPRPWYSTVRTFSVGLTLDYAHAPLVFKRFDTTGKLVERSTVVEHQFIGHLSVAGALWDRVNASLHVPLTLVETGSASVGAAPAGKVTFGDPRVALLARLYGHTEEAFSFHAGVDLWIPFTGRTNSSDGFVRFAPRVIASGTVERFGYSTQLAFTFRNPSTVGALAAEPGNTVGSEVSLAASGQYALVPKRLFVGPELVLATTVTGVPAFQRGSTSIEGLVGASWWPIRELQVGLGVGTGFLALPGTPDFRALARIAYAPLPEEKVVAKVEEPAPPPAAPPPAPPAPPKDSDGDGLLDPQDECPDKAGPKENRGCPDVDSDGDGLVDRLDHCAKKAEDKDGFQDEDGCPDPDNDGDGIVDAHDRCVSVAGVPENRGCPDVDTDQDTVVDRLDNCPKEPGPKENNGCKQKQLVEIRADKLVIYDSVYFKLNKAIIEAKSFKLLDNVANIIAGHPELEVLRVEGHTDSQGNREKNLALSRDRAEAVKAYLVKKGIDPTRLAAQGFGPDKPIDTNATKEGRAKNRRVEFNFGAVEGVRRTDQGPGEETKEK